MKYTRGRIILNKFFLHISGKTIGKGELRNVPIQIYIRGERGSQKEINKRELKKGNEIKLIEKELKHDMWRDR